MRRLRTSLLIAAALAIGLVPALAPAPVAAARPNLTLVGAATYDVLPDTRRVAVSVRLTATNHLRDTVTRRYFFRTGFLSVLPGSSKFRISGGNGNPKVGVTSRTRAATNLRIDLGADLAAGRSTTLTLTFELKDPGGAPDRPVRISPSLVTFAAWAFATPETPGASVAVRLPSGYDVSVGRGPLDGPEADGTGHERWSSGALASPLEFVADVAADRAVERAEMTRTVPLAEGAATVLVRSWPDDLEWRDRVAGLVERALPVLEREIGLPWPVQGPLAVEEALVRGSTGYAGVFAPAERRIEISYAAPDVVVLHELAHAWFNGRLVADRWAAEAFASYYADVAATELGLEPGSPDPLPPGEPGEEAIPLNAWGPTGSGSHEAETYAYSASFDLARVIAERAGADGLRRVWTLASRGVGAYRLDPAVDEPGAGPPDWRGLLDLIEDETDAEVGDLWRTWVARPGDLAALDARAAARSAYDQSVALAGEWRLPASIREAMRAWRFDLALEGLAAADAVQGQRTTLEAAAGASGLTLPDRLRATFEGPGGPAAAAAEATAEQAVVDAITAAAAARPTNAGAADELVVRVGLLGTQPEEELAASETALAAGDLEVAYRSAQAAEGIWESAAGVGRSRMVSAALLVLALVLFIGLLRQARRGRVAAAATAAGPVQPVQRVSADGGVEELHGLEDEEGAPPGAAPPGAAR